MQDSRNNIMFRKQKEYSGRNDTCADAEYAREQARIESLKKKREEIEEHRRVTHHGSTEEKAKLKYQIGQDAQLQLYIKDQKNHEDRQRHQRENESMESHRRALVDQERQREAEKRERLRQMQEANRIAAMSKRAQNLETKVTEDYRDRETIKDNIYRYQPNVL